MVWVKINSNEWEFYLDGVVHGVITRLGDREWLWDGEYESDHGVEPTLARAVTQVEAQCSASVH